MVLIGVHSTRGGEAMPAFVKENGVSYPVAVDADGATVAAFAVDSYPDYYLIDRAGKLRFADLANRELERAIDLLLAEPAPDALHPALAAAGATAAFKDKRLLVRWDGAPLADLTADDRALAKLLRNEYEVVELARSEHGPLADAMGVDGPALAALDAGGALLAVRAGDGLDASALRGFLEEHRVPQKDAAQLWRGALEQAKRENKRVLVHLGAPW